MLRLRFLLFFLCICLSALSTSAQRLKIFGSVRDSHGTPIELASVRVAGTAALTVSNLKGEYTLHTLSSDSVVVVRANAPVVRLRIRYAMTSFVPIMP